MRQAQLFSCAVGAVAASFGLMLPALGKPDPDQRALGARLHIPQGQSVVISMPGQSAIAIIGPIDSGVLASYRAMQSTSVATRLYIDSSGGDVPSAIAIADDLRKRGTRLIVAGRCFSACANYIFTGTVRQDVLPGSLIGIHSSLLQYDGNHDVTTMPVRHAQQLEKRDADGNIKKQVRAIEKLEENFYSRIGLSSKNFQTFESYQARFELAAGKKYPGCRKIDMWILSKNALQNMGISGMNVIWTPATAQEAAALSNDLGLDPAHVFFGSEQQLNRACTPRDSPVITAKRDW